MPRRIIAEARLTPAEKPIGLLSPIVGIDTYAYSLPKFEIIYDPLSQHVDLQLLSWIVEDPGIQCFQSDQVVSTMKSSNERTRV
jgi:hypothetical protein